MYASSLTETPEVDAAAQRELRSRWPEICRVQKATFFGALATLGPDGPQITPIGSVMLHPTEPRGYYHPVFTARMQKALTHDQRFELLFVDTRALSWLNGLLRGRFDHLVAVRLKGHALGARRQATPDETERFQRIVRPVRWTRGYKQLWKEVRFTQELQFDAFVPVRFGATRHGV